MVIASENTVDDAIYSATDEAVMYLMKSLDISWEDAYILASLIVDIKVNQVVDPKKTVRAAIPKNILGIEQLFRNI